MVLTVNVAPGRREGMERRAEGVVGSTWVCAEPEEPGILAAGPSGSGRPLAEQRQQHPASCSWLCSRYSAHFLMQKLHACVRELRIHAKHPD